ncbi:MAG TPA: ABC transporter permease [Conexibacter sp.]|jgi:simple sugar transport system permease protein|nr:ABC transporter permease [Conexibacter sp.]
MKSPRRLADSRVAAVLPAALIALAASGGLVALAGVSPLDAYRSIWSGGLGSTSALGTTLVMLLPLLFAALAFAVPFRAGLYNIGVEGQLYLGALSSAVVGLKLHAPTYVVLPVAVLAGMAAGMAWAVIPALLKVTRGVNEIVSSLFLNYVAIYFTNWLLAGPLEAPNIGVAQTSIIPDAAHFPVLVADTKITYALLLALVVVVLVQALFRTPFGFDLRIMGASGKVADYLGIRSGRATIVAFAISGAIGGLAGVCEVLGNQFFLSQDFSPGWGYTGIAVAVLGGGVAWGIALAAAFFGVIGAGALQMQFVNQLSPSFALVVQAVAVIVVLLFLEWRSRGARRAADRPEHASPAAPTEAVEA